MLVEAIMFTVGAFGTAAIGIPIAVRLANAQIPGFSARSAPAAPSRNREGGVAGFTPLDLGEDPTQWPSATPWPSSALPQPDWPSKLWDDEHFGRHWDKIQDGREPGRARKDADDIGRPAPEPRPTQKKQKKAKPLPSAHERARAEAEALQRRQQAEQDQREAAQREAARQALAQKQAQRAAPTPAPQAQRQAPQAPAEQSNAPSKEELLRLVESVGLAGTVQEIMGRTGWDFRKAAQYLAKVRAGG